VKSEFKKVDNTTCILPLKAALKYRKIVIGIILKIATERGLTISKLLNNFKMPSEKKYRRNVKKKPFVKT
jgi:hypothetical protein|tara:strand:+ start:272 stop:481 length:210 start_codon:yes stop_codon:yes gene_type:complete